MVETVLMVEALLHLWLCVACVRRGRRGRGGDLDESCVPASPCGASVGGGSPENLLYKSKSSIQGWRREEPDISCQSTQTTVMKAKEEGAQPTPNSEPHACTRCAVVAGGRWQPFNFRGG